MRADSLGNETSAKINDYVDIGIFGPSQSAGEVCDVRGKALLVHKFRFSKPAETLHFVVADKLFKAGVDPCQKLIERFFCDNVRPLEEVQPNKIAVAVKRLFG